MQQPLFTAPSGLKAIPTANARYYYLVDDPATRYVEIDGVAISDRNPLAMMDLGEYPAYESADGEIWRPSLSDLTERGRMLRDVIFDNLPAAGNERIVLSLVPVATPAAAYLN